MLNMILGGFVTGFVMSAPIGPMMALAALRWTEGRKTSALAVMGGVCAGDLILAIAALLVMQLDWSVPIDESVMLGVAVLALVLMGGWMIWQAGRPTEAATMKAEGAGALLVTLMHPANVVGYGLAFSVILPEYGVDVENYGFVGHMMVVGLLFAGMLSAWLVALGAVELAVRWLGTPTETLRAWMARIIGIVMLVIAGTLALSGV